MRTPQNHAKLLRAVSKPKAINEVLEKRTQTSPASIQARSASRDKKMSASQQRMAVIRMLLPAAVDKKKSTGQLVPPNIASRQSPLPK